MAIAGIIVPGTILLFAIAVMAGSGALSLGETLLLGLFGGLLGDLISYGLGRRFHQGIRRLPGLAAIRNGWPGPRPISSATALSAC